VPTNAGVYTVTATTPADENFTASYIVATLTIEKAPQTITSNLPASIQLNEAHISAGASVNSNLPLTYQSGNTDIATIDSNGQITLLKEGSVTFTISQAGNENYRPASETRTLSINSMPALLNISVNGHTVEVSDNMLYVIPKEDYDNTLFTVVAETESGTTVDPGKTFTVTVDKPQLNVNTITITTSSGTSKTYTLTIERRFLFEQIVIMRWNNTLTVINNPANNGGYTFIPDKCKWYRNGEEIGTGQSWSAGANGEQLNPSDLYYVEVMLNDSTILRTYESNISLKSLEVKAMPNPVTSGQTLYVQTDVDEELLENAVIEVYNATGNRVARMKVQGQLTPVDMKYSAGIYFFVLKGKDGFQKDLKVIVK
jgi:hypothetical protein